MAKPIKIIDVRNMSREDSQLLYQYFNKNPTVNRFKKENLYPVSQEYNFKLSHTIIRFTTDKDKMKFHILTDKKLGKGAAAQVVKGGGELIPQQKDGFLKFKKIKKWAVKYIHKSHTEDRKNNVKNEVIITNKAGLKMRQPVYFEEKKERSYLIMNRLTGRTLSDVLKDDEDNEKILTTDQRILLAKNMLEALVKLGKKDIVHLDFHSENIMVNTETGEVTIFDFGLSKEKDRESVGTIGGTLAYASPEHFELAFKKRGKLPLEGVINTKTDGYSLRKLLARVFKMNDELISKKGERLAHTKENYKK